MKRFVVGAALLLASTFAVQSGETMSPEGAKVYFINLKDGDVVKSPVHIQFGLSGMGIAPSGVEGTKNTGHHHLIINEAIEGEELDAAIDKDEQHRHFGGGQTESMVELPAGKHVLQLVLGDWSHVPHNPPVMSERITITVQ
jgi:hypothetical protein